jgi:hypothetical protein
MDDTKTGAGADIQGTDDTYDDDDKYDDTYDDDASPYDDQYDDDTYDGMFIYMCMHGPTRSKGSSRVADARLLTCCLFGFPLQIRWPTDGRKAFVPLRSHEKTRLRPTDAPSSYRVGFSNFKP